MRGEELQLQEHGGQLAGLEEEEEEEDDDKEEEEEREAGAVPSKKCQ